MAVAITPQFPLPLPPWAKFLIKYVLPPTAAYLLDHFTNTGDVPAEVEWRKAMIVWRRGTPSGTLEDAAVTNFDIINITGGNVDTTWNTADYTTCETALDNFLLAYAARLEPHVVADQIRWYRMAFNPATNPSPYQLTGPPQRIHDINIVPGTSSGVNTPYQVAFSVTEKTPVPRHWGRFYLPHPRTDALDQYGRWKAGEQSAVQAAAKNLYQALYDAEFQPVIPVTQIEKVAARVLMGVTHIQTDDIPDVIRSRRARSVNRRLIDPVA